MEKKKVMLIIGGASVLVLGYLGFKYFSKSQVTSSAALATSVAPSNGIIAPPLNPPAGTTSLASGGLVSPSGIVYAVPGGSADPSVAANAPAGYGYDYSQNVYGWISSGTPPNGVYTIPVG